MSKPKSEMEHKFTSTGQKFWQHRPQMESFRNNRLTTVISTHVSPTGECNLKCRYCSVAKRKRHNVIPPEVIDDYVTKLMTVGLKAVIITGGGEPLCYHEINELIIRLRHAYKLRVALITNGTLGARLNGRAWAALDWVRLSLNNIDNLEERIHLNLRELLPSCVIGGSIVYAGDNKEFGWLQSLSYLADRLCMRYIRVLPDCTLPTDKLLTEHKRIAAMLRRLKDPRFFQQWKVHRAPACSVCTQSFFRPYLSEALDADGKPGSVMPCDSLVLNTENGDGSAALGAFTEKYRLCSAKDVLLYLNHQIKQPFDAHADCTGCVFADTVEMLHDYKHKSVKRFAEFEGVDMEHRDFV